MSPYLWHNCGAPSLKSLPGGSRLWLNPARELCERLLFSWTYIEHPSEVRGWLMFPQHGGMMIQVGAGCCCPRFIPGDDSGVQHSPRWADGGSWERGTRVPAKTLPGESAGALFIALKGKMLLWTQNWLWTLLGEGGIKKNGHCFPSKTKYVFSEDDTNLKSKA